ncbi:MAG TPA: hypothetical protein VFD49_21995 [Candidatus Dormibacteraeota bacterium]|nr:hypothetical protein [Candidatus Dormibacteraeota bacterium]
MIATWSTPFSNDRAAGSSCGARRATARSVSTPSRAEETGLAP